jgi:DNA-binding MarR family transcriptional regulator
MNAAPDLSLTKDCYCLAARKTARAMTRVYEQWLRPHGLRATQFSILAALALKGPTRIAELANMLGLERTTLSRGAAVLERNGWLCEARSEDGRERPLQLTGAGKAKLEAALPDWEKAQSLVGGMLEQDGVFSLFRAGQRTGEDISGGPARPQVHRTPEMEEIECLR